MKKTLVGKSLCRKIPTIYYYLLTEVQQNRAETYGVMVQCAGEKRIVRKITESRERMLFLLERLRRGCVTPLTALDVIEDWLLE